MNLIRKMILNRFQYALLVMQLLWFVPATNGQTIQFSIYVDSNLDATTEQHLDLGMVIAGSGLNETLLGDAGMGVFSITGNKELDVIVTMTADDSLKHTGASTDGIPFTVEFAYANLGENNVDHAIVATSGSARFQIQRREYGPPGGPPTPPSANYTPPTATAYIYVYGSMNVGYIDPGSYTGNVNLSVVYD